MTNPTQEYRPDVPVDEITPHPLNARVHDDEALDASIESHGFYGAVLLQASTLLMIGGEGRWKAAQRAGHATVPAILLDVDDDEAAAILADDNAATDRSGYDQTRMVALIERLKARPQGLAGTLLAARDSADSPAKRALQGITDRPHRTERRTIETFDQVHVLLSFPPEQLGSVQAALDQLDDAVSIRSSYN